MDGGTVGSGPRNPDGDGLNSTPPVSPQQLLMMAAQEEAKKQAAEASAGGAASAPDARPSTSAKNKETAASGSGDVKKDLQAQLTKLKSDNIKLLESNRLAMDRGNKDLVAQGANEYLENLSKITELTAQESAGSDKPQEVQSTWRFGDAVNIYTAIGQYDGMIVHEKSAREMLLAHRNGNTNDGDIKKADARIAFYTECKKFLEQQKSNLTDKFNNAYANYLTVTV